MEIQLQIYLILGIGGMLILGLILSNCLLIYYVTKLHKKLANERRITENSAIQAYDNQLAACLQEELDRRYTQYTPEPTLQRPPAAKASNKNSLRSQNSNVRNSVITASEEFRWTQNGNERTSQYNSNIVLKKDESEEGTMRF